MHAAFANMKRKFRAALPAIIACALICAILFSSLFVLINAHHNCAGDDCAVCAALQCCSSLMRALRNVALMLAALISAMLIRSFLRAELNAHRLMMRTLVAQHVQFND